ncbi:hypothetical protein PSM36_1092 [Proteiniphilum saccharofermentans]|uniref:DUF4185 domain-containing protein n=1 Tax=Proteiniphilum saccharofermentans TaxID=1642647 RepID=A0A1R3T5Q4_9BACT|nr:MULTISPECIES: DUF4185 domain-containing protein [Proteiniphilum]MDY9919390.1 DUF4185 domain-containing protein [Proteiniphilum sp.]SCD19917.1 hypothetical protein PSM36_1092 [Proteiniphilum saccharofermentans]SFK40696.1 hypothetical protein SAMN05216357_10224 [Porphyromonadaceae bacterium KH3CP3RA]
MKYNYNHMVLLSFLLFLLASCSKSDDSIRKNPFEPDGGHTYIKIATTFNADTLSLSWELTNPEVSFDNYRIELSQPVTVKTVEKGETTSYFTRVPYNEPVSVTLSLVKGSEVVNTNTIQAKIDGLDKVIAGIIIPDQGSVTAGDGMYSIPLPDGRSIFLMGDSYIGTVTNGQRPTSDRMYRNTYIVYDNGKVSAIYGYGGNRNASAAVPPGYPDEQKWYWPGHGFVNGDKLYIFQTLMYQGGEGMWGFMYETTHILEYNLPGLELNKITPIPFNGSPDIHYGMAALNDGDYNYIYAQVDIRNDMDPITEVLVARTAVGNPYDNWQYYNGSGWSINPSDAVKLEGLSTVPVSSQFNVFKLRGKYVLLTQKKTFNSGEIYTFIADNPTGPWRNKQLIFRTYEQNTPHLLTYNAMAHPQFEKDGMILVSYNVNTEVFAEQFSDVSTYRPRFFWIDIDKIMD